jgi:hypothetical protein
MSNAAQITGNCALFHVAAKLSRLDWAVSMTTRNARGADMFAVNADESVVHPIQSKGLAKRNAVPLGTDLEKLRSRWWVITVGAATDEPVCYVLTLDEVKERASRDRGRNRAFWLEAKNYMLPGFEEAWERLGDPTAKEAPVMTASGFEVGAVISEYSQGHITVRKHVSGSFTTLVNGELQPARQLLLEIRDQLGLPDKATNTTRSLGAQIFGAVSVD